ncbi:MAG TPA: FAD binding domain-containing protein [Candidatus Cloacimonadota bacterium]|mgnify:CR=1 FL=1|nr:FAD binding domain-containing protein [Candidatus Cloacimonadota bacterium]
MPYLECFVNNQFRKIKIEPGWTSLYLIREILGLTGTKESCSEGDCGACTVVVGEWINNSFVYRSVNSCIYPAVKLQACHLITIEGLSIEQEMHPIQQFLLDYHGTQCGFCTPGIVMSFFALFSRSCEQEKENIFSWLEGNLCRCTGYESIVNAGLALSEYYQNNPDQYQHYFPTFCQIAQKHLQDKLIKSKSYISSAAIEKALTHTYLVPQTIADFFEMITRNPSAKIINGGSDIMVDVNIRRHIPLVLIDISQIKSLQMIQIKETEIIIGASVTYHQLLENEDFISKLPVFKNIIPQIASQQIRNIASISGNIANASPVGDMACVLLGLNAKLIIAGEYEDSTVYLRDFYLDYKKTILNVNDLIKGIIIPLDKAVHHFEKSTKRKAVDISAVVSFSSLNDHQKSRISFGGVAAFPKLIELEPETFKNILENQNEMDSFAESIANQFQPISDVRGSIEYRNILIKNHIISHLSKYIGIYYGQKEL